MTVATAAEEALMDSLRRMNVEAIAQPTALAGGGNNRVYRVDTAAGPVLVKRYFRDSADPRDRLRTEFEFLQFAWSFGVRCVPRPIARDDALGIACYEFIEGKRLAPGEVGRDSVRQAMDFCQRLQSLRDTPGAKGLSGASEACFCLGDHIKCVESRVERLKKPAGDEAVRREVIEFVFTCLIPAWRVVRGRMLDEADREDWPLDHPLSPAERCLSPSDFGFHNALRQSNGRLRFIDFEYAGWDDPAKLVCDFFCQPQVPVSMEHFSTFAAAAAGSICDAGEHLRRVTSLLAVYRVKWCCIMLNVFLPDGGRRRRFAQADGESLRVQQRKQLDKAVRLYRRIAVEFLDG